MKYYATFLAGGVIMGLLDYRDINDLRGQIEKRDSVNTHNIKVIKSLEESIRLDSLTLIEQLYPKK